MVDWQPIETAPKDQSIVEVFWDRYPWGPQTTIAFWDAKRAGWYDDHNQLVNPTHWRPWPQKEGP